MRATSVTTKPLYIGKAENSTCAEHKSAMSRFGRISSTCYTLFANEQTEILQLQRLPAYPLDVLGRKRECRGDHAGGE